MRLVSQDGMIDVPYDKCCLEVEVSRREGSVVYFIYAHTNKMTLSLARYSTEAKALKVMEMLRKVYSQFEITKIVACGSSEQISKQLSQKETEIVISDFWKMATFQFPKDEEVEV